MKKIVLSYNGCFINPYTNEINYHVVSIIRKLWDKKQPITVLHDVSGFDSEHDIRRTMRMLNFTPFKVVSIDKNDKDSINIVENLGGEVYLDTDTRYLVDVISKGYEVYNITNKIG